MVEMEGLTSDSSDLLSVSEKLVSDRPQTQGEINSEEENTDSECKEANSRARALRIGGSEFLLVTHVVSPREFYFIKERDEFYNFCKKLNEKAEKLNFPAEFSGEVGSLVFVSASDNIWYRYVVQEKRNVSKYFPPLQRSSSLH